MDFSKITPIEWVENEERYLHLLEDQTYRNRLPLMNVNEWDHIDNSTLVRFRGMIQDMHSPEYYLEKVEVVNESTNERTLRTSRYCDVVAGEKEYLNFNSDNNSTAERQTYVVISVPGINEWAFIEDEKHFKVNLGHLSSGNISKKRNHQDSMDEEDAKDSVNSTHVVNHKKVCNENSARRNEPVRAAKGVSSTFPLPDESFKICHLKVYNKQEELKLNNVYEFIGFLSVDALTDPIPEKDDNSMEFETLHPPSSLVPRIHCVSFRKLKHHNPLLTYESSMEDGGKLDAIRKELMLLLKPLLLGDELAAEYLLLHLISEIYLRRNFMPLGKFSLNFSNIPKLDCLDYVEEFYKIISNIVHKSYYLPMTLENLNNLSFVPKKDYESNCLISGVLQLSDNTHVVLDETKLSSGKLDAAGVNNVKAISSAIKNQKVAYDFNYYSIEYECDIPFLILSEGKSMLYSDVHIPIRPDSTCINTFREILQAADHFLKPSLLEDIRKYLTSVRLTQYEISENVEGLVQNEFVKMRQQGAVSPDDLHELLVTARLLSISQGKTSLDENCWRKACNLQQERKSRLIK
nr:mini-chromosome maintenance complex-binding protein [Leptinotarsa decemlineata]